MTEVQKQEEQEREQERENKKSTISFLLQYDTQWGENLVLVGSSPTFGDWNATRGQRMKWLPGNYWELTVKLIEPRFEYKYVVVLLDGVRFVDVQHWEERNNRHCDLTGIKHETRREVWNC